MNINYPPRPINPADRARETLAECDVDLKQFKGVYSDDVIQRDMAEVTRLESVFEQSPIKKYGDIFEAIVFEHGEQSNWFGESSQVVKTSRYDDYINKIDLIVESRDESGMFSQLALGVDVTFGSQDLSKKFNAIRDGIDQGRLGSVKYFLADRPNGQQFAGPLNNIPHIVAGIEVDRVTELGRLWVDPKKKKELAVHPIQMTILEEAALQLEAFAAYAGRSEASENTKALVPILNQKLQEIKNLIREKRATGITGIKDDKVFEEIKRNLQIFTSASK